MKTVPREHVVFEMGASVEPVLRVESGEVVLVETEDCFGHQILSPEDSLEEGFDYSHVNPATGPVYIEGATPGDVLRVHIRSINLDKTGVNASFTGWGPLGSQVKGSHIKVVPIEGGSAVVGDYRIPLRPMIGVIGVAPRDAAVPNSTPGAHGGNLDTREITAGARVYLPVSVAGGFLALGDLHATMGDGEVCGTGVEIRGSVEIQVDVLKGWGWTQPVVELGDNLYFLGSAPTLDDAVEKATLAAVDFLHRRSELPWHEAYMLASLGTDLMISQVVNPWKTVKVKVPRDLVKSPI